MALDPASPKECCQSKKAEHCPTSCLGLVPEHSAANVDPKPALVHTNTDARMDAYAHVHFCLDKAAKPSLKTLCPELYANHNASTKHP